MLTPGSTAIIASADGVTWSEIGRVHVMYFDQLRPIDGRRLIAAGNTTEPDDEGFITVPSSGIWELILSDES